MGSMARLLPDSRSASASASWTSSLSSDLATAAATAATATSSSAMPLAAPFPGLGVPLSDADLRTTAYEVLVAASRATVGRPLIYIPQSAPSSASARSTSSTSTSTSSSSSSSGLQRSRTSTAASKVKRSLGLSPSASSKAGTEAPRRPETVMELVRVNLRVTEQADSRIRRGLLRIAAGQLGRRAESMILPLEFLQRSKASDFPDPHEYEAWQFRNLKLLEAGLLVHPLIPLSKSDIYAQTLREIISRAYDKSLKTEKNLESMQELSSAVKSLAGRSLGGISDECHWADGFPFNLHIYQMLVEACFDCENGTVVDEIDEVMGLLKKTWVILGINQMLHNLCFTWALFNHFATSDQVDMELLSAAENQLSVVVKDAKTTEDPDYCDILISILSSITGWTEKRLLAYHETFNASNIVSMQGIVAIGVSAAKILLEDISQKYPGKRKQKTDVVRGKIETYIRSSLRTAFAQRMDEADSKRSSRNPVPVLAILAKDISDLASKEKNIYSPILKKWHPLASGVAVTTLHSCFGNELKQFMVGRTKFTPDTAQVLNAADKLEKNLVNIAVEDFLDSDDGGKSLIRQMPPYEAENAISALVKGWMKERVDKLKEWVDQSLQQETWNPKANRQSFAPSSMEMLRMVDEILDAFFQLPISMHSTLISDLTAGLDGILQYYVSKAKACHGTESTATPQLPHLTRCDVGSKLFKKKEKPHALLNRGSQVGSSTGKSEGCDLSELCVQINTFHYIRTEVENLKKKAKKCLRNSELSQDGIGTTDGMNIKFELSQASCQDGIRQLCDATAHKVVFSYLSHVLLDMLYVGGAASNRVEPLLRELHSTLGVISGIMRNEPRDHLITALMKASFDGFLLVLLAGGPTRAFTLQDAQIIENDFRALRGLYLANGDGLPHELVDKASSEVKSVLPLLRTDTESLIQRFKQVITERQGSPTKSSFPKPPRVPAQWSANDPNTILRVLCYRYDEAATKFLKKTYKFPKKL
uniref:MHD1 domain-containing protein n=2 Tax=Triticum urartu TaxID=4572 RepID=A0A8R7Q427_TRIUA